MDAHSKETNETSWEKPEELMTEDELNASGEWVWIKDKEQVYILLALKDTPRLPVLTIVTFTGVLTCCNSKQLWRES